MKFSRRLLLKSSAFALVNAGFLQRAFAQTTRRKTLVVIFQRGGADGLSMVPPTADGWYGKLRPNIAIAPGKAVKLDDSFGLHPALAPLEPLYRAGALAVVHGVASPAPTRSHFDAQDFIEAGTPGSKVGPDGWLNRVAQLDHSPESAFKVVALGNQLPRSLVGPAPAVAMPALSEFRIQAGAASAIAAQSFESMYASAVDTALKQSGAEAFDALGEISKAQVADAPPQNGAEYPKSPFGKHLEDIARLIHADLGLRIATTDVGGWDTHVAQGAGEGQLANRLKDFAQAISAFATDLGEHMQDVCVVTMTEFGRTVRENGNRGTDHGTASVMFALGAGVRGGRVLGGFGELKPAALFEGRDLAMTTDFRDVLAEAVEQHLGVGDSGGVFPGLRRTRLGLF